MNLPGWYNEMIAATESTSKDQRGQHHVHYHTIISSVENATAMPSIQCYPGEPTGQPKTETIHNKVVFPSHQTPTNNNKLHFYQHHKVASLTGLTSTHQHSPVNQSSPASTPDKGTPTELPMTLFPSNPIDSIMTAK